MNCRRKQCVVTASGPVNISALASTHTMEQDEEEKVPVSRSPARGWALIRSVSKLIEANERANRVRNDHENMRSEQRSALADTSGTSIFGNVYFFLLDSTWYTVSLVILTSYLVLVIFMWIPLALLFLALGGDSMDPGAMDLVEGEPVELNGMSRLLLFSLSNVVTMGFGQLISVSDVVFLVSIVQNFVGILANVFVLSVAVTKFQRPAPDIIFSKHHFSRYARSSTSHFLQGG